MQVVSTFVTQKDGVASGTLLSGAFRPRPRGILRGGVTGTVRAWLPGAPYGGPGGFPYRGLPGALLTGCCWRESGRSLLWRPALMTHQDGTVQPVRRT